MLGPRDAGHSAGLGSPRIGYLAGLLEKIEAGSIGRGLTNTSVLRCSGQL